MRRFTSPRAWAYALLGIDEYLRAFEGDSNVQSMRKLLAERLARLFRSEPAPTGRGSRIASRIATRGLSQALIVVGRRAWSTRK